MPLYNVTKRTLITEVFSIEAWSEDDIDIVDPDTYTDLLSRTEKDYGTPKIDFITYLPEELIDVERFDDV